MKPRDPKAHPNLLFTADVAAHLRMSPRKIRELINRPVRPLPSRKIDGFRVFWKPSVDQWLADEMTGPTAESQPTPIDLAAHRPERIAR